MNEAKHNFKPFLKNYGSMKKNYTLLIVSYESTDDAVADNLAVVDLKNKKFEVKQGFRGKNFYAVEHVQPLSGEEANSIMQP